MSLIGQLHPLLIHLPIGILISGIGLYWYDLFSKERKLQTGIELLILFSAIFGMISVITGLVLSNINSYDTDLLQRHQYSGIILTIFIVAFYISLKSEKVNNSIRSTLSIVNLILLFLTGHFGGTITHGQLTLNNTPKKAKNQYYFDDSSTIFSSMVQPIIQEKCTSCHGEEKQKGNLRLDSYENIVKGGKNGHTLDEYGKNEIIKRLILTPDDEKHMPPKERTQLSKEENNIIHWWILHGAKQHMKIAESSKNDTLIAFIRSKQINRNDVVKISQADLNILNSLRKIGATVYPIEINSPYLYVNLQNVKTDSTTLITDLSKIIPNVIELKLSGITLNIDLIKVISRMNNLEKLDLSGSFIDDDITKYIKLPSTLKIINFSNAKISEDNLLKMSSNSGLEKIFTYNLQIDSTVLVKIKNSQIKEIFLERAYVPTYPSDTVIVK